jgi:hypothetical protein
MKDFIADLKAFRSYWTGQRMLNLLVECGGQMLITWPIGVGKSYNIDELIEVATHSGRYDLVVVLLPTRNVLDERRWIKRPPLGIKIVNLRPRPSQSCGDDVDRQWKKFESRGLSLLGRILLCRPCPSYHHCFWPNQYGRVLRGTRVIFATQSHLERDPTFLIQLRLWTGSQTLLVILDETNFITKSFRRKIQREHIQKFMDIVEKLEHADS